MPRFGRVGKNTHLRHAKWHVSPWCHWCGRRTTLDHVLPGQRTPGHIATIDHVLSRYSAKNLEEYDAPENKVLSCYKCNHDRACEEDGKIHPRKCPKVDWSNPLTDLTSLFEHHGCNPRVVEYNSLIW